MKKEKTQNLKRCGRCKQSKLPDEFPRDRTRTDGKYGYCSECVSAVKKKRLALKMTECRACGKTYRKMRNGYTCSQKCRDAIATEMKELWYARDISKQKLRHAAWVRKRNTYHRMTARVWAEKNGRRKHETYKKYYDNVIKPRNMEKKMQKVNKEKLDLGVALLFGKPISDPAQCILAIRHVMQLCNDLLEKCRNATPIDAKISTRYVHPTLVAVREQRWAERENSPTRTRVRDMLTNKDLEKMIRKATKESEEDDIKPPADVAHRKARS